MNIAVLVSGTYRETDFILDILPKLMKGVNYDIYLVLRHTLDELSHLGDKEKDFTLPASRDNVFMCELPAIDREEAKSRYLVQVGPTDPERECALLSMFHGVFTAIQMMKSSLRKYDYVMKTRTDYLPPMTLKEMLNEHEKTGKIIVDGCANWYNRYPDRLDLHWHGSLNDIFTFASYDKFIQLWDFQDILPKVWTGIPETTLYRAAQWRFIGDDMQSPRKNETFLKKYFTWGENNTKQSFHVLRTRPTLHKTDEATYFKGDEVVKYFTNPTKVLLKVERARLLEGLIPQISKVSENFFTYKYVDGMLLSEGSSDEFAKFLEWMQEKVWQPKQVDIKEACHKFYHVKTNERLKMFHDRTNLYDKRENINGVGVLSYYDMEEDIDWDWLCKGIPCLWHGDPQPENVLITDKGFTLLDWREDFAGLPYGDVYYDLAKVYHALLVPNRAIRSGKYKLTENPVTVSIEPDVDLVSFMAEFQYFVDKHGYDFKKVLVLSALIYLNICPLYEPPYNKFLFYYGKKMLHEIVEDK